MTLNQVYRRIKDISTSHRQVRSYRKGLVTDFFTDKTAKYPAICMQDSGGIFSTTGHSTTLNFRMYIVDMVNVSQDTKSNEDDVLSDMVSIGMDVIAQLNYPGYNDWKISTDNSFDIVVEQDGDMYAGITFEFSVSFIFAQNVCQVPSDLINYIPTEEDMKYVYDEKYIATGAEGKTLSIPALVGKKVLFITRGNSIIYKTSSSPDSNEYVWNDTVIQLGTVTTSNEPFLILYRNY